RPAPATLPPPAAPPPKPCRRLPRRRPLHRCRELKPHAKAANCKRSREKEPGWRRLAPGEWSARKIVASRRDTRKKTHRPDPVARPAAVSIRRVPASPPRPKKARPRWLGAGAVPATTFSMPAVLDPPFARDSVWIPARATTAVPRRKWF